MNQRNIVFGFILLVLVLVSHASFGHARFDENGNIPAHERDFKNRPCGGIARTATNKMLTTGRLCESIGWRRFKSGRFEIIFPPPTTRTLLCLRQSPTTKITPTICPLFQYHGANARWCVVHELHIAVDSVMTENPAAPTFYYACADITLQSTVVTQPAPLPTPTPTGPSPNVTSRVSLQQKLSKWVSPVENSFHIK